MAEISNTGVYKINRALETNIEYNDVYLPVISGNPGKIRLQDMENLVFPPYSSEF